MRISFFFLALVIGFQLAGQQLQIPPAQTTAALQLEYASTEQAKILLTTEDAYTDAWSQFDIDSKGNKKGNTKEAYFQHITEQVLEWTDEEKEMLNHSLAKINTSISEQNFKLRMDKPVIIIKTTSKEEGGAMGYTRGNYIVLSQAFSSMEPAGIDHILAHELFHVISRAMPELRKELYSLIGFYMMPAIDYPKVMEDFRITNPDATQTDNYIDLKVGEETVPCMMILYSKRPYDGGSFFNYLNVGFLRLSEADKKPVLDDEGPVIYAMSEIGNFFEQVGRNTQYIIHPEEIMADNFTFAILGKEDLSNPELVAEIKEVLSK